MGKRIVRQDAADAEKSAMLACSALVAGLMPATAAADADHPAVCEAMALHSEAQALMRVLASRGTPWNVIHADVAGLVRSRPTPLQDALARSVV
jgi:hypothetical protein